MSKVTGIKERMARELNVPAARMRDDCSLRDLVSDSFTLVEWVMDLQEIYRIRMTQEDLRGVQTVGDVVRLIEQRTSAA